MRLRQRLFGARTARRRGGVPTVVVLAAVPWVGHQLYDQRIAAALARRVRVVYVEPPRSVLRRRLRSIHVPESMIVVSPVTFPWGRRPVVAVVTALVVRVTLTASLLRYGLRPNGVVLLGGHPVTWRTITTPHRLALVLDDYVAGAALVNETPARMARHRLAVLRHATTVAVVSPVLRDTLRAAAGVEPFIVPGGCTVVDARPRYDPPEIAHVPRPRAVFIGAMSDRIDFAILDRLATDGIQVVLVGGDHPSFSTSEHTRALEGPRIHRLGHRTPESAAAIVAACDVGLLPYERTDFNEASFPLKTLEYLAEGLPVVAVPLPALAWLASPDVTVVPGLEEWSAAVKRAAEAAQDETLRARRRQFAREHSWDSRAEDVLRLLALGVRDQTRAVSDQPWPTVPHVVNDEPSAFSREERRHE